MFVSAVDEGVRTCYWNISRVRANKSFSFVVSKRQNNVIDLVGRKYGNCF